MDFRKRAEESFLISPMSSFIHESTYYMMNMERYRRTFVGPVGIYSRYLHLIKKRLQVRAKPTVIIGIVNVRIARRYMTLVTNYCPTIDATGLMPLA
jgi:hypothetical protein